MPAEFGDSSYFFNVDPHRWDWHERVARQGRLEMRLMERERMLEVRKIRDERRESIQHAVISAVSAKIEAKQPEGMDVVIHQPFASPLPVIGRVAREGSAPFYPSQPVTIPVSHGQAAAAK